MLTESTYANSALTKNVDVFAYYQQTTETTQYALTFYHDGAVWATVYTAGYEVVNLPDAPTKDGYTFKGWFFEENGKGGMFRADLYQNGPLTCDISLYSFFEGTKYTITFYNGDSVFHTLETAGYASITLPNAPDAPKGFFFDGWFFEENGKGDRLTAEYYAALPLTANVNVYAYFKAISGYKFTISFYDEYDKLVSSVKTAGYETVELPHMSDNVVAYFVGWYLDKGTWSKPFLADSLLNSPLESDLNVYAYFKPLPTIWFYFRESSEKPGTQISTKGHQRLNLPSGMDTETELFEGWYFDPGTWQHKLTEDYYLNKPLEQDINVYGHYVARPNDIGYTVDEQGVITKISLYKGAQNVQLVIPSTVNGKTVIGISTNALSWNDKRALVSVQFPDTMIFIGKEAFFGASNLLSVGFSSSIERIEEMAFSSCSKLASVVFPEGLTKIEKYAFEYCSKLTNVTLPNSLKSVGEGAFANTQIAINAKGDLYIGNWLISIKSKTTSLTVKDGTVGIADHKDSQMSGAATSLTQLTLPSSLKYIGTFAFSYSQITAVSLPAELISIGANAFYGSFPLATVDTSLCSKLEYIGDNAFASTSLATFYIPLSVTTMGENVFNHPQIDLVVSCAATSKPEGWHTDWAWFSEGIDAGSVSVKWGVTV